MTPNIYIYIVPLKNFVRINKRITLTPKQNCKTVSQVAAFSIPELQQCCSDHRSSSRWLVSASYTLLTKAKQPKAAPLSWLLKLATEMGLAIATVFHLFQWLWHLKLMCLSKLQCGRGYYTIASPVCTQMRRTSCPFFLGPLLSHHSPICKVENRCNCLISKNKGEVLMQTFPLIKVDVLAQSLCSREKGSELGPVWLHTTLWFAVTCYLSKELHKMFIASVHNLAS